MRPVTADGGFARQHGRPPASGDIEYVALGDSFSSGQGAPPFDVESGDCHRSPNAYPRRFAITYTPFLIHAACSGAKIKHVLYVGKDGEPRQIDWLKDSTDLVTITIGGNDIRFKWVMATCAAFPRCDRLLDPLLSPKIEGLDEKLQYAYEKLAEESPGARFLVLGYPHIFPKPDSVSVGCSGISRKEMGWLREKTGDLYLVISEAVERARSVGGADVSIVPGVLSALRAHELCTQDPWVNPLVPLHPEWSFHPNMAGQAALAALLEHAVEAIGSPSEVG
jgi:hypothetical protein